LASSPRITVGSSFDAKGIQQAQRSLKKFADESRTGMDKFQDSMKRTSKTMGAIGSTMTRSVTLPLAGIAVASIKTATDFESSMTRIQSLVGFSAEAVGEMNDAVLEMAGRTATAPKQLADALFFATSAGLDAKNALEAVEQAARASAIGLGDTQTIVDLTTSAMNAYGAENLDAAAATDALTMAVRLGKLEPAQLAGAMGSVLPIASAMGIEFHEIGAAFAAMSRTGTDAATASTQFRGILSGLLKPSKEASDALASIGLSTDDVHKSLREDGFLATLEMLIEGLGGNATAAANVFGNVRALSGVMDLLGSNADATREVFDGMANSLGVTDEAFAIASETAEFQFKQALADLQSTMITLGNILLPIATDIAKAFAGLVSRFSELGEGTQKAIVVFGGLLAVAGPVLIITGKMIGAVGQLAKAYDFLRKSAVAMRIAMVVLRSAMIGVPLLAIAAGALAVFAAFRRSGNEAKEMADKVNELKTQLEGGATATEVARTKLEEMIQKSPAFGQAMLDAGVNINTFAGMAEHDLEGFNATVARVAEAAGENVKVFNKNFVKNKNEVKETINEITTDLMAIPEATRQVAESAVLLDEVSSVAMDSVGRGFEALGDLSAEALMRMMDEAERAALGTEDAMRTLGEVTEIAAGLIEDELKKVEQAADDLAKGVDSAARSAADSFLKLSDEGKQNVDQFIEDLIMGGARLSVFQDNVSGIAGSTSAEFGTFLLGMGADAEGLINDLADPSKAEDLQKAFRVWEETTALTQKSMSDEFAKVDPEFQKTLQGLAGLTVTEMDEIKRVATEKAMEVGTALMLGQVEGITRNSAAVEQALRNAVNAGIAAAIEEAEIGSPSRRMAEEVGEPMGEGIAVGIEESAEQIESAMRRTIQLAMVAAAKDLDDQIRRISERSSGSFLRDVVPKAEELMAIEHVVDEVTGEIVKMGRDGRAAADVFVENLITSSKRLSGFQDNVLTITDKTSAEFGLYLLEMGVDAEHLISDLADPDKLHVLDQAYAAWVDSTEAAQRDMSSEFAKVDPAFAAILENLNLVVEEEMKPVIETAARSGRSAGSGMGNSMADGIRASIPAVVAAREALEAAAAARLTGPPSLLGIPQFSDGLSGQFSGGSFLSRRDGGIVPGPPSMPVPILAHGGEYVLSADIVDAIRSGGPSRGLDATPMVSQSGPAVVIENYTSVERSDDDMLIGMLEFAVRGGRL
jgi:TP901 family phage tail tape measure protein